MSDASWQQRRQYPDHLGHPVILEEYDEPGWTPEPVHQLPIQVYSTVPLDTDHEKLRDYLLNSFYDEEVKPLFEIYSYCPPDAFACIEHHRREIAYRKQQHTRGTPNPPPLIPQFFHANYELPIGCCILLRSHSYREGYCEDDDIYTEAGLAPDWLYFNRIFSTNSVSEIMRRSSAEADAWSGPIELYREAFEMEIEHVKNQREIGQKVMQDIFQNSTGFGEDQDSLHYATDVDEGVPPDPTPPSEVEVRQQLDQQIAAGNFALDPTFQLTRGESTVTISNTPEGAEPDLQYFIYTPFLSHLGDAAPALLESAARLFTAALRSFLSPTKTFYLEFHIPTSSTWSGILPAHRQALNRHGDDFPIGALYNLSPGDEPPAPNRVNPQRQSDTIFSAKMMLAAPYRMFAVVLDKPSFVSEPGVCFYMAQFEDPSDDRFDDPEYPDTEIWRSAGISDVARRLAMLAVEEAQNGVEETRVLLPDEDE